MSKVLTDLYSLSSFEDLATSAVKSIDFKVYGPIFALIENLIICEKVILERNGVNFLGLEYLCKELSEAIDFITDDKLYKKESYYEPEMVENDLLVRGLIYADVANAHDLYYSPHPHRQCLFADEVTSQIERAAKTLIHEFDQKFSQSKCGQLAMVDAKIPPVVEHVLFFSMKKKVSVIKSICEIRQTKNAIYFRQYFNEIDSELQSLTPRKRMEAYQPLFRDIDRLCTSWISDLDSEVRYKQRRVNLGKIPILGRLLELVGAGTIDIKDPIIAASTPHLLFINDLYRTTK